MNLYKINIVNYYKILRELVLESFEYIINVQNITKSPVKSKHMSTRNMTSIISCITVSRDFIDTSFSTPVNLGIQKITNRTKGSSNMIK